jgi:hypothetical protein
MDLFFFCVKYAVVNDAIGLSCEAFDGSGFTLVRTMLSWFSINEIVTSCRLSLNLREEEYEFRTDLSAI